MVFPEPPLPRKVTNFVGGFRGRSAVAVKGDGFLLRIGLRKRRRLGFRWKRNEDEGKRQGEEAMSKKTKMRR